MSNTYNFMNLKNWREDTKTHIICVMARIKFGKSRIYFYTLRHMFRSEALKMKS